MSHGLSVRRIEESERLDRLMVPFDCDRSIVAGIVLPVQELIEQLLDLENPSAARIKLAR